MHIINLCDSHMHVYGSSCCPWWIYHEYKVQCKFCRIQRHTRRYTHFYYHCQIWLCGPQSGGDEPAEGNKTGGPATQTRACTHKHARTHFKPKTYTNFHPLHQYPCQHTITASHASPHHNQHMLCTTHTCESHAFQDHISHHMFLNGHPVQPTSPW